jgi:SpoVK/Ycf46/Vps4 family AAA+-type ATPase
MNQLLKGILIIFFKKMEFTFNSINDIILIAENYKSSRKRKRYGDFKLRSPRNSDTSYNVDLERLSKCIGPLKKLNDLIGMDELKKNIVDQILFYAQDLNTNEMMHTCLTGPPGVGKTTLGKILAELYCSLGFLETDNFNVVTSADLIAGYIGQTAIKTRKILKKSLGGVLFLDEAYAIGTGDSESIGYSKECADTINAFLSENTSNFIMIIAGYREELDRNFFTLNPGLRRRFPWIYDIVKYSTPNLMDIFIYQVYENDWMIDSELLDNLQHLKDLFEKNNNIFNNNGGDTLTLFDKAKIIHSRRVFGKKKKYKRVLNLEDIASAIELVKVLKNKITKTNEPPYGMYL